jgi:peptidyl-prolyl cis-trans isomerase SurA
LDEVGKYLTDDLIEGKWNADTASGLKAMLFKIGGKIYTQADFANYIGSHQVRRKKEDLLVVMNGMYNQYVQESLLAFEESQLPYKYPEYKALLKEYRDGILLFDLTDSKVWSKAVKDTAGLKEFHAKNSDKFMWGERLDAEIYYCQKDSIIAPLQKELKKKLKKGNPSTEELLKQFNANSSLNLRIESDKYEKDEEEILKNVAWEKGIQGPFKDGDNQILVLVKEVIPPTAKSLKEARGLVTAEYQNYLEKQWISELRAKYRYTANEELLKKIK